MKHDDGDDRNVLAISQHLFPKESIEICITFQVPLILHLEMGASFIPSFAIRTRALKCLDVGKVH